MLKNLFTGKEKTQFIQRQKHIKPRISSQYNHNLNSLIIIIHYYYSRFNYRKKRKKKSPYKSVPITQLKFFRTYFLNFYHFSWWSTHFLTILRDKPHNLSKIWELSHTKVAKVCESLKPAGDHVICHLLPKQQLIIQ